MEDKTMKIIGITLLAVVVILSFLIVYKSYSIYSFSPKTYVAYSTQNQSFLSRPLTGILSPGQSVGSSTTFTGSSSVGAQTAVSLILTNEYVSTPSNSIYNSNLWYNEKFYPGNVSSSSNSYSCSAIANITAPHLCISLFSFFSCGGGPNLGTFSHLVGYLGYPLQDNNFPNNNGANYSNLYSSIPPGSLYVPQVYQLPSSKFEYENFINWSSSTIHPYSGTLASTPPFLYAINTSFDGYPSISKSLSIPSSTLIIPAISCGSTFINNYINFPVLVGELYNISTLSGFTPSVYLASKNENGFGADYARGYLLSLFGLPWTGLFNSLLSYQVQSISPAFNYTMPTEDYAKFPTGNVGDSQYINVSNQFLTPLSMGYFQQGNNTAMSIYVSNTSIASVANISNHGLICKGLGPHGTCETYTAQAIVTPVADTFTSPDLEAAYYPNYGNGVYLTFRTDGIFPICAWNSTTGNTLSSCTFEKPSTVNNVSYERLWLSNNLGNNQLYDSAFTPGYSNSLLQNNFTITALDSFCFYGENFNTANGVYTSPSYTRIIPPTAAENYTSAIGTCNAFFNNTNCFSNSASEYLNFEDGIFARNVACTPSGIQAKNVTDAWLRSIFVANNAGNYCGYFKGQKNSSMPLANSTLFLQTISTNCPEFNINSSSANLVVTVKNVGNMAIQNPYLVALYGNNNLSTMFYSSQNDLFGKYALYKEFLSQMDSTTGIIEVEYNKNLDTNMYVFDSGHNLNPIPIQSLFQTGQGYINGPFNNSLLGMFIYAPNEGLPNNLIRTSNIILSHSASGSSQVPVIQPNGTATFTIQVPMPLFEALLSGKYNLSIFFGNTFNVSWNNIGVNTPENMLLNPGASIVNPLVPSSTENTSQIHNNEIFVNSSSSPSPLWQYIVSYSFNMANSPFRGIGVYSDNLSINVLPTNSTANDLNVTVNPFVSVLNGSGVYSLSPNQLSGSSVSCFASPDNIQDFGVFWSRHIVSPSNFNYALSNSIYTGENKQASQILITKWTGMLFMPYSDQVSLNYNNLPIYYSSTATFQIETPTLNTTSNAFAYEAFDYFGNGSANAIFSNLSNMYSSLNSSVSSFPVSLPNSSLTFNLVANSIVSDPSILRVVGVDTLVNYSTFANKPFSLSIVTNGATTCSTSYLTSVNSTYSLTDSGCLGSAVINHSLVNISSKIGPFFVDMYNNSNLNLSNETAGGTVLMGGNETLSKANKNGLFYITIPINTSFNTGITAVFSPVPLTRQLYNADVYLYNINGTPFNCNIVNTYNNSGNLGVSLIGRGEYFLPNGTMMCNLMSDFTYLRAVFVNSSNNVYLGSGDIQSGLSISNVSTSSVQELNVSINGMPVDSQNAMIDSGKYLSCSISSAEPIYNGLMDYPSGCNNLSYSLITFGYNNNGTILPESAVISPKNYNKNLMYFSPSVTTTPPVTEYNLTLQNNQAKNIPIQFTLPNNFAGCNDIILVSQSPYPYAEVPYQVISSTSQSCDYVFIGSASQKYSVFETNSPSVVYSNSWLDYNASQYNVQFSNGDFGGNLISSCRSGFGPCVDSFSINGNRIGNLLFNNVSTSSATISQSSIGPVEDCFTVGYSSSQTVNIPETGFGSINYASNKVYQTIKPSQSINSEYCLYRGSPVITDAIQALGSPIKFNVQNQMISKFSYIEDNNHNVFYVPPAVDVGYSSYSNVNISQISSVLYNISSVNLLEKCYNYSMTGTNVSNISTSSATAINETSADILNREPLYCVYGSTPSYTPQLSFNAGSNSNSSTKLGFAYQPGNYTNGIGTLYDSCTAPSGLTASAEPVFLLNGQNSAYDGSNNENSLMANSANSSIGLEMLYSPAGSVFINKCAPNSTILSYSACTKSVAVIPQNGSNSSLEALPQNGELYGGGCLIGTLNGLSYSCAPTDGELNYRASSKSSKSSPVSISQVILNETSAPTPSFQAFFDCTASAQVTVRLNNKETTSSMTSSCSSPGNTNTGICSASVSYSKINSTAYNITAECSAVSTSTYKINKVTGTTLSNLDIQGSQSEQTGLINPTYFVCGNKTNFITKNVLNGWNWKPYSTSGLINPVPTTNPNGVAEVGGCEAGRNSFETQIPNITSKSTGNTFQFFYSCNSGYSGTIMACSQATSLPSLSLGAAANSCYSANVTLINSTVRQSSVNGNGNGGMATACNSFSLPGYIKPTIQDNCIAYHFPVVNSTYSSYELQYSNSSHYGLGMGILGNKYKMNVSIPNSKEQNSVKDSYFTGLSESQIEGNNTIFTNLLPTMMLESNLPSKALSISAAYSYDLLNILMLQNPFFGVSGISGFINGSILDEALSIFTGGTSGNCAPPYNSSGDAIFTLGEGELCSGKNLPSSYKEGVFLSLGTLNEGLHSIQFYSVGNTTNEAQPTVNVFDSVGSAVNLNSACSNGNQRVFTSVYNGGKWNFNITSDQQCNPVNNKLYGYIVNCVYQTPGDQTYAIASKYYLAYDLPTVWNISYSLLVSPKSYEVVPTPIYQINYSTGSILTLQQPNKTLFIEKGLPGGYKWTLYYDNIERQSSSNVIYFYLQGTHTFTVKTLSNASATDDCYTTYTPSPAFGSAVSGTTTYIQFEGNTTCSSYFKQTGLPNGLNWNVTYDGIVGSTAYSTPASAGSGGSASAGSNSAIEFITNNSGNYGGNFSYSIPSIVTKSSSCINIFKPAPYSGHLPAGTNQSIVFSLSSDICATTFIESGLPNGVLWTVNYAGKTNTSTSNKVVFAILSLSTTQTYPYKVFTVGSTTCGSTYYSPSPPAGSIAQGSSVDIIFTKNTASACSYTLTESGLPSSVLSNPGWSGTIASAFTTHSTSVTQTSFNSPQSFTVNNITIPSGTCGIHGYELNYRYSPTPSSGQFTTGEAKQIDFTYSQVFRGSCTPLPSYTYTLTESGLPSSVLSNPGWSGTIASAFTTTSKSVTQTSSNSPQSFTVDDVSGTLTCVNGRFEYTRYSPSPSSGSMPPNKDISFTGSIIKTSHPCAP